MAIFLPVGENLATEVSVDEKLAHLRRILLDMGSVVVGYSGGADSALLLKVAPDLTDAQIEAISDQVAASGLDGIIVSNTTVTRPGDLASPLQAQAGGLSGAPLMSLSTAVLARFHSAAQGRFVLIGAGGVASGADAYAKIRAGACAVQLYSALVYEGPGLVRRLKADLAARLKGDGFVSVAQAIGVR